MAREGKRCSLMLLPMQRRYDICHTERRAHNGDPRVPWNGRQRASAPGIRNQSWVLNDVLDHRRQARRRVTHRQHQTIGAQPLPTGGYHAPVMPADSTIAYMGQAAAVRFYRLCQIFLDVATKCATLRVDAPVRQLCLRVLRKIAVSTIPTVECAVVVTRQLHSRCGNVDSMRGIGRRVGHTKPKRGTRLHHANAQGAARLAQQMKGNGRAAESAPDNHNVWFAFWS